MRVHIMGTFGHPAEVEVNVRHNLMVTRLRSSCSVTRLLAMNRLHVQGRTPKGEVAFFLILFLKMKNRLLLTLKN